MSGGCGEVKGKGWRAKAGGLRTPYLVIIDIRNDYHHFFLKDVCVGNKV